MTGRRIVVFAPRMDAFGGVERLLIDLSRFLNAERLPHTILCLNRSIDLAARADWPMEVMALDPPRNPLSEANALMRYFDDPQNRDIQAPLFFDLKGAFYAGLRRYPPFHLHLTDPPSLLPADISKHAPSLKGGAGPVTALRAEIVHQINRCGVRRALSLIAMTEAIAGELETLYGRRAQIVRPGVRPPYAEPPSLPERPSAITFLSVSRLEKSKRINWILEALAELEQAPEPLSRRIDWTLDIVGEGSQAAPLRDLSRALALGARVRFHGALTDERLEAQYAKPCVFLMPAVQGYGLPALEALSRGRPVILHRQSGVSEILDQPPWVETIEEGHQDLARAIERMSGHLLEGRLTGSERPPGVTADDWARNITRACDWH